MNMLAEFWISSSLIEAKLSATLAAISMEEVDVEHYISGFVCCKLKERSKFSDYRVVVRALESDDDPDMKTDGSQIKETAHPSFKGQIMHFCGS